ncbi:MAG: glycoside hydrolase family 3 protein [Chloroflexota bacterium]|nr:glycoside hydrolase family 3 protein [Chloroflexota bacterium]
MTSAFLAGCMRKAKPTLPPPTLALTQTPSPPTSTSTMNTPTSPPIVSLAHKIGQMLMVGFRGLTVDANSPIVQDIRNHHLGGVVLFDYDVPTARFERNIASPAQLKALTTALQSFAATGLLIATDQEGGLVNRLREGYGFPPTVSHQMLGTLNDPAVTREQAGAMARTLSGMGINFNLAPVVDLNLNPTNPAIGLYERSFSADPAIVIEHAQVFIDAHHAAGVLCALKHFPGHGSSTADTHLGIADVSKTWSRRELEPYTALIAAGEADAVMTAHVFNANLDPTYPATLSQPIISGLLRKELGYDGVVITDDMQMGAIRTQYGFETAIQKTIEAGVDIIAIANNLVYEEDVVGRTVALIQRLVAAEIISEARIDASYQRIQRLKSKLATSAGA